MHVLYFEFNCIVLIILIQHASKHISLMVKWDLWLDSRAREF